VIIGVVSVWALGVVTYFIIRADRTNQQAIDYIMAVRNKDAAVVAGGMDKARKTPILNAKAQVNNRKIKARTDGIEQIWEDASHAGVLTPEQEKEIERLADGRD